MNKGHKRETARTVCTGGVPALLAERPKASSAAGDRQAAYRSLNADGAVAFGSGLRQGGQNPDQRQRQNNRGHGGHEIGINTNCVEASQFVGARNCEFGHASGSIPSRNSDDWGCLAMANVKDRGLEAQKQQGHADGGQRDIGNRDVEPRQSICESFKLCYVGRGVDEIAGHWIIPISSNIFVNSGSNGNCIKFSTIWNRIGKRAMISNENNGLKGVSRVDTGFVQSQSTLTGPFAAGFEGCQPC